MHAPRWAVQTWRRGISWLGCSSFHLAQTLKVSARVYYSVCYKFSNSVLEPMSTTEIHYRTLLWLTFNVTTEKQLAKGLEERAQQDVGRLYTLMRTCRNDLSALIMWCHSDIINHVTCIHTQRNMHTHMRSIMLTYAHSNALWEHGVWTWCYERAPCETINGSALSRTH